MEKGQKISYSQIIKKQNKKTPVITLMTDFGYQDIYVGEMKGVILSLCPDCQIIDMTHSIKPFDIKTAAYQLNKYYKIFPPGTIHVCVIDPGVGSQRLPLIIKANKQLFVGPDNGLFTMIVNKYKFEAYEIKSAMYSGSATFHGRDIFAPVAGQLALGRKLPTLAASYTEQLTSLEGLTAYFDEKASETKGHMTKIDRFGNIETNIIASELERYITPVVKIKNITITGFYKCFSDIPLNEPGIIVNSYGLLEIVMNKASAEKHLKIKGNEAVLLKNLPKKKFQVNL